MDFNNELKNYVEKETNYNDVDNIADLFLGDENSNRKLVMILKMELENKEKENTEILNKLESYKIELKNKYELEQNQIVNGLLDIIDEFDRLNNYVRSTNNENLKNTLEKNMKYIYGKLNNIGIEKIACINEKFDETYHECKNVIEDDSIENFTIVEEIKQGYTYKGNVIRAAEVEMVKNKGEILNE